MPLGSLAERPPLFERKGPDYEKLFDETLQLLFLDYQEDENPPSEAELHEMLELLCEQTMQEKQLGPLEALGLVAIQRAKAFMVEHQADMEEVLAPAKNILRLLDTEQSVPERRPDLLN